MNIVPLLVTSELGIILTLEMTKLRLTRLSDLPKVIQLLSDEAWLPSQCAPNTIMCLPPTTAWAPAWLRVKPFGLCGSGRKNSCLASHHMFGASGWECHGLPRPGV